MLDPTSGILVIDAPPLSSGGRTRKPRRGLVDSFDPIRVRQEVARRASELTAGVDEAGILNLPVACVLAVPDHGEIPVGSLGEADRGLSILSRSDLTQERLGEALRRILGGGRPRMLGEREEKQARAVVNPEIVLPQSQAESLPLFQDPEIPPEDVIRVMDREQERVAEYLGAGYRVLRGVAGSGKTLVLAHRARYLHKNWPRFRILVLCFNRVLAEAFKTMVGTDDRIEVTNIDRLSYRLAGASGAGGSLDFDLLARQAKRAARRLPDSKRFDAVLVDEAQDFDHARLDLAYSMLKSVRLEPEPTRGDRDNFVMAYDVAQNVYRRGGARWNPPGVDSQGRPRTARGRSTVFRRNYRNTREILGFAMSFLTESPDWSSEPVDLEDPSSVIPPEAAKRSGPRPRLASCRDVRGEAEGIAARVDEVLVGGASPGDIAVLYGTSDLEKELRPAFSNRGLPYFHVQGRDYAKRRDNRDTAVHVLDKVRASTLTGIKGLEFSRVLIGGVNHIRVVDVDEDDQLQAAKSQLYAAMTRAMDELEITMSGDGDVGRALLKADRLQRGS